MIRIDGSTESYLAALSRLDQEHVPEIPSFSIEVDNSTLLNLTNIFCWMQDQDPTSINGTKKCHLKLTFPEHLSVADQDNMIGRIMALLSSSDWRERLVNPSDIFPRPRRWPKLDSITIGRLLPMLSINSETYRYLAAPVADVFDPKRTKQFDLTENDGRFAINTQFPPTICTVIQACSAYLLQPRTKDLEGLKDRINGKRHALTNPSDHGGLGNSIYQRVAGWPVLAFLLWAAFDRALDTAATIPYCPLPTPADTWLSNLSKLELDVLDIADGLLQLAENIVLHAGETRGTGRGVMAFRIHQKPKGSKGRESTWASSPLQKSYSRYFEGRDCRRLLNVTEGFEIGPDIDLNLSSEDLLSRQNLYLTGQHSPQSDEISWWAKNLKDLKKRRDDRTWVEQFLEVRVLDRGNTGVVSSFHKKNYGNLKQINDLRAFFDPSTEQRDAWLHFTSEPNNAVIHYGLQLFDSLLAGLDGALSSSSIGSDDKWDTYSSSGDHPSLTGNFNESLSSIGPSGTCYSLLVPLRLSELKNRSLAHAAVDFRVGTDYQINPPVETFISPEWSTFHKLLKEEKLIRDEANSSSHVDEKAKRIQQLVTNAPNIQSQDISLVIVFDADSLDGNQLDILGKSLLLWLSTKGKGAHVAVRNLDRYQLRDMVRLLAIFCDRQGDNKLLINGSQIYLACKEPGEDFWLPGVNVSTALTAQLEMMSARSVGGVFSSMLTRRLTQNLARRLPSPTARIAPQSVPFFPFDLTVPATSCESSKDSLFDRAAKNILTSDIQDPRNPGCRLKNAHVRIGSKIHMDSFYEAQLFFSNNYYIARYAWLVRKILGDSKISAAVPTLLIGYETYSEMLVRRIMCPTSTDTAKSWSAGIYETRQSSGSIRWLWEGDNPPLEKYEHVVYLVPISSTMTTFRKMKAHKLPEAASNANPTYITVVHIRDEAGSKEEEGSTSKLEEHFFTEIDAAKKTVTLSAIHDYLNVDKKADSKKLTVDYIHQVTAKWEDPLTCNLCFPLPVDNAESPLAEAAGSPVVLSQLFGRLPLARSSILRIAP